MKKGFLDIFIERDDKTATKEQPSKPQSVFDSKQSPLPFGNMQASPLTSASVSSDDMSKFDAHFDDLFDKSNFPGADYYEFVKMVKAMGNNLSDEVKFAAAYGGLTVQGLNKEKLISTAQQYIDILDKDQVQFNQAIDGKIISDINNKKADIESRRQKIKDKEELIAKMQGEILQENKDIVDLSNQVSEQEKKASNKSAIYKAALENRKAAIQSDIQKINTYIK